MSKLYIQKAPEVWSHSASLVGGGGIGSGSFLCAGYSKLRGLFASSASSTAEGFVVSYSSDYGSNWDYTSTCTISACSGSILEFNVYGNMMKVDFTNAGTDADEVRAVFHLLPI